MGFEGSTMRIISLIVAFLILVGACFQLFVGYTTVPLMYEMRVPLSFFTAMYGVFAFLPALGVPAAVGVALSRQWGNVLGTIYLVLSLLSLGLIFKYSAVHPLAWLALSPFALALVLLFWKIIKYRT
jgi:hypothetical protein